MKNILILMLVFLSGCSAIKFTDISLFPDQKYQKSELPWRKYGVIVEFQLFPPPGPEHSIFGPYSQKELDAMDEKNAYDLQVQRWFPEPSK